MKYLFIGLVTLYQKILSPLAGFLGARCRFYPTCSEYSRQAFSKYGAIKGLTLSIKRISRCHPWGGSGIDELP